ALFRRVGGLLGVQAGEDLRLLLGGEEIDPADRPVGMGEQLAEGALEVAAELVEAGPRALPLAVAEPQVEAAPLPFDPEPEVELGEGTAALVEAIVGQTDLEQGPLV